MGALDCNVDSSWDGSGAGGTVFGEPKASFMYHRARQRWGWLSAYALIPINLISARTNYADFVLPGGTIFLILTKLTDRIGIDWTFWPPRPSTAFACLPVIRNSYNYLYEKAFGNLNRNWMQEIQPRHGQNDDGGEGNEADQDNDAAANEVAEGDVVLELNLEIGMEDNYDEENQEQRQEGSSRTRSRGTANRSPAARPQPPPSSIATRTN